MVEKKFMMPCASIINKLTYPEISKQSLFKTLHDVAGDEKLEDMRLPTLSAVVSIKNFEAVKRANDYIKNTTKALPRISKMSDKRKKSELLDMLNKMAPKASDYAVISLNTYLKMDKKHTIEGFYKEYNKFVAENTQERMPAPMMNRMMENRLRA